MHQWQLSFLRSNKPAVSHCDPLLTEYLLLCRRRRRRRCSLVAALLYITTAGVVATFVLALWQNDWQIEALSRNPLVGPSEAALRALGSLSAADVIDGRQYWRLISSIFLCSGESRLHLCLVTSTSIRSDAWL